jgi:TPR repeat protein
LYYNGKNLKQGYTKAVKYYEKACEGGHNMACVATGFLYYEGAGVKHRIVLGQSVFLCELVILELPLAALCAVFYNMKEFVYINTTKKHLSILKKAVT